MVQVLHETKPTARTEHTCSLCGRTIRPGETYTRSRNISEDSMYTWRECEHCTAMLRVINLWDWLGCPDEGYTADDMCEYEPANLHELRLKVLWQKRWTRRDGTLYAVPALEHPQDGGQR